MSINLYHSSSSSYHEMNMMNETINFHVTWAPSYKAKRKANGLLKIRLLI